MALIAATLGRIRAPERRTMGVACGAHMLHDGYTDLLYVLLPLWQAEFGLGYAEIGLLRALFAGSMAGFQVPAAAIAERIGGALGLGLGTGLGGAGARRQRAAPDRRQSGGAGLSRAALAHRAGELQFLRRPRQNGLPGADRRA